MDGFSIKVLLLLTILASSVNCGRKRRMIDGTPATRNEFPYVAGLQYKGKFWCGATIISKNAVLTAAHCVYDSKEMMEHIKVRVGGTAPTGPPSPNDPVEIFDVFGYQRHFYYGHIQNDADAAIIWIKGEFVFKSNIAPIKLAASDIDTDLQKAVALGWGRTKNKKVSDVLLKIELTVLMQPLCEKQRKHFTKRMLCAWVNNKERTKSICDGDSGGPLVIHNPNDPSKDILIGVISAGSYNCDPKHPQVFGKVAVLRKWIIESLKVGPYKNLLQGSG